MYHPSAFTLVGAVMWCAAASAQESHSSCESDYRQNARDCQAKTETGEYNVCLDDALEAKGRCYRRVARGPVQPDARCNVRGVMSGHTYRLRTGEAIYCP
jgi:hypothetical protein